MLSEALKMNSSLTKLNLNGLYVIIKRTGKRINTYFKTENDVCDEGASKIGEALKINGSLRILILSSKK